MPISQVLLSDTFGQFRNQFNDTANAVNSVVSTSGVISTNSVTANTVSANNLTSGRITLATAAGQLTDDSALTYDTSTDILTLAGTTDASSSTTGTLKVAGGVGVAKKLFIGTDLAVTGNTTLSTNLSVTGNATITGDLTVNGTTTTINSTTLTVDDKNIELGSVASPTDITANGGGITIKGATDKTIIYDNTNDNLTSSENWNIATGKSFKINNVSVLNVTTLGSGVTGSSLTSVGTITTGVFQGTVIDPTYGGTGVNNGAKTVTLGGNLVTSGAFNTTLTATANTSVTLPTSGTLVGSADTATVTNTMLTNNSLTIGNTNVALGATSTTLAGLTSVTTVGLTASGNVSFTSTGALKIPSGTTGQQSGYTTVGMIRFDTSTDALQVYKSTGWAPAGSSLSSGKVFFFASKGFPSYA